MRSREHGFLLCCLLGCALGLGGGCGKSPAPDGLDNRALGSDPHGAPMTLAPVDTSILGDQSAYTPAADPSTIGSPAKDEGEAPAAGTVAETDAATAARTLVMNLVNDLQSGEIGLVLGAFDQTQIQPLLEKDEFLWATQEAYADLEQALIEKLGDSSVEQLNSDLRQLFLGPLNIDVVSPDSVAVTPNPLRVILSPEHAGGEVMNLARTEEGWRIRLPQPLTAEDVEAISAFHETLKDSIWKIADGLANGQIETREAAYELLLKAGQGEEIYLSTLDTGEGEETGAAPDEEEEEPEEPAGGGGGGGGGGG